MKNEAVRMGYVGCGFMAQNVHLPHFASLPGSRLLALAELRPQLARSVAEKYHIPKVYSNHLELANDPEIEAVGVSAHFAEQGQIAADLLRAGKHVFMEKPMAVSHSQAERMLEAAREGRSRLMVAYMKRYDSGNILAREIIARWRDSGEHGDIIYARNHGFCGNWIAGLDTTHMLPTDEPMPAVDFASLMPDWLPQAYYRPYLNYLQQYTHNVNLLRYLLNVTDQGEVASVDLDADGMTGITVLRLGGVRCVIESSSTDFHAWDEHTQVYFKQGWVHVWAPQLFQNPAQSRVEIYEGGNNPGYHVPVARPLTAWAYHEEATYFLRALRSGEPFPSSGEDTLNDVRLFEGIYKRYLHTRGQ